MALTKTDYSSTFNAIARGATVVTANQRLARWLRGAFDTHQESLGVSAWRSADILPWSTWIARLWNEAQEQAPSLSSNPLYVLRPNQALALWERIIAQSPYGDELLQVRTTARQAQLAWSLIHEWQIDLSSALFNVSEDTRAFYDWAQQFKKECTRLGALDNILLVSAIRPFIKQGHTDIAKHILLAGFDEFTPQQTQFFQWLRSKDFNVESIYSGLDSAPPGLRIGLPNAEAEIETAARWARGLLLQKPQSTIGVVVLDLQRCRAQVERIFAKICHPASTLINSPQEARAFNISLGLPLGHYPVIHGALVALNIARGTVSLDDVSYLLRSPFFAGAQSEISGRALFDVWLRERGEIRFDVRTLLKACQQRAIHLPMLCHCLAELSSEMQRIPRHQAPSAWAATFGRLLNRIGWPGDRSLNSEEFQTIAAWQDCLSELASLDEFTTPRLTFNQALSTLEQLAIDTVFQAQSDPAPIQIMGMLEASGLSFDALWVMGLHDGVWPAPVRPNPFIPLAMQQIHGLPHASSECELSFARTLTQRFWRSATQVIVSYPLTEQDEELRPSPLLQDCPILDIQQLPFDSQPSYSDCIYQQRGSETLLDTQAPPLAPNTLVHGGTAVIKHQAACPFRAFAQFRLGAEAMPSPQTGLGPRERGILVHAALEHTWTALTSLATLQTCDQDKLMSLVQTATSQALQAMAARRPETFTATFVALEQQRLEKLVLAWLAVESERAPFTVVASEQQQLLTVGQLQFKGKIDRLDRLADGRHVIVDYKMTSPSPGDWFGPRPDEPQMPLYGAFHNQQVAGLIFGQVKIGEMKMRGLASDNDIAANIENYSKSKYALDAQSWPDQMQHWKTLFEGLSDKFRLGDARVDPKGPATCAACHLTALCRIHERITLETDGHD